MEELIPNFDEQFYLSSVHKGELYGTYANALRPSEVAVLNGSGVEKLSHINEVVLSQYQLGETVEINYKAPDGMDVQGWYILPPDFDNSKKIRTKNTKIFLVRGTLYSFFYIRLNLIFH